MLISLLIVLLIAGVVLWALPQLPLDATIVRVIRVVVIVAVLIYCIRALAALAGHPLF
jgi:cytochrome b subunit of formate dehydrogenase